MENRINIAALLKHCPTGMELNCAMFSELEFDRIDENNTPYSIICRVKTAGGSYNTYSFTEYGCYNTEMYSKCVIFPKGKNTWKGFVPPCQFKNGDVVATTAGAWIGITTGGESGELIPTYCVIKGNGEFEAYLDIKKTWCFSRFATKEERQKLFDEIKAHGYIWNSKTKTLEEITKPNFKVGNVIQDKDGYKVRITEVNIEDECYGYESMIAKGIGGIAFREQDDWELVPNKFDINTLIPFESKVLVRHNKDNKWTGSFFSFIDRDLHSHCYKFVTTADKSYPMMIPFKGNEYLLGKTDDCQDFYKTWE